MSILKLGKITLSTQRRQSDFFVALSLDSSSGFTYPYLINTVDELTSYFGEFRQKKLCEKLLENEIPVLVLPVLSKVSWANRSSLRICNSNVSDKGVSKLTYCHPRLENSVIEPLVNDSGLINSSSDTVTDKSLSLCIKLEFTKDIIEGDNAYFILPYINNGEENLVLFTFINPRPIEEDYYDSLEYPKDEEGSIITPNSVSEVIEFIESKSNTYGYKTIIFSELLKEIFSKSNINDLVIGEGDIQEQYSQYEENLIEFVSFLSKTECYLDNWSEIIDKVERILRIDEPIGNDIYYTYDINGNIPEEVSGQQIANGVLAIDRLDTLLKSFDKTLLIEYESYVKYCRTNHFEGLRNYTLQKYNDRVLNIYTNKSAIFEVFSRVKGPKGNQIHVNIERYEFYDFTYIVRIISEEQEELYYINTDLSVDINSLGRDFQRIQYIDQNSELVSLKVFDYILSNGTKIDKRDWEEGIDTQTNEKGDTIIIGYKTYEEFEGFGELKTIDLLPDGYDSIDIYLDNAVEETATFYSRENNLEVFKDYEYYPDFFLEDIYIHEDLYKGISETELSEYLDKIYDYCRLRFTQSLVDFSRSFLDRENTIYPQLGNQYKESRILKFYNTIIIENEEVCSFYPLILNFLESDYLSTISEDIIGRITLKEDEFFSGNSKSLKDARNKLIKARLNFIDCDNINYFYTNIREQYLDPSFILRFCVSKLSREIMINERLLIACPQKKLEYQLNAIVSKVINLVTLVSSLTYTYEIDNHNLSIEFSMDLPKIVNKTYVFNITLNY